MPSTFQRPPFCCWFTVWLALQPENATVTGAAVGRLLAADHHIETS